MSDLIDRQAAIDAIKHTWDGYPTFADDVVEILTELPSAQPETHEKRMETHACDLISRQGTINAILSLTNCKSVRELYEYTQEHNLADMWCGGVNDAIDAVLLLPSVQPEWNNHTIACMLAELFGDTCACNYNGIDEWLPYKCELLDSCPNPVGVACWEQYLKHRAERRTDG